jgi:hypothetical protein
MYLSIQIRRTAYTIDYIHFTLVCPRESTPTLSSSARLLCPRLLVRSFVTALRLPSAHSISATLIRPFSLHTPHHNLSHAAMVVCTGCMVENQDARCGHVERYCHGCCTTNVSIDTCLHHFKMLGSAAQITRLASGKVMAQVTNFMADSPSPPSSPPHTSSLPSVPSSASAPGLTASSIAAMRAELETERAASQVERAAVQAQLNAQAAAMQQQAAVQAAAMQQQAAATQQILAMLAALQTPASAAVVTPLSPAIPVVQQALPAVLPTMPPPHHQALLDASPIDHHALLDQILRGPGANEEVKHSAHIAQQRAAPASSPVAPWLNPLPEALIPSLPGSERDNTQILTSIITGLKAREVKYTTLAQLDTALGDWWKAVVTTWSGKQLNSLMLYRRFVIDTLGKRSPLHSVVRYHTLWTKAVNDREHDMFAVDGHIYLSALIEAEIQLGPATSTSANKGKKPATPSDGAARKEGETSKKTYAAGSCTHHPESVTHTTAQCKHPK